MDNNDLTSTGNSKTTMNNLGVKEVVKDKPSFGHPNMEMDTDSSRQRQPVKRSSALSTASASASTLSTWD